MKKITLGAVALTYAMSLSSNALANPKPKPHGGGGGFHPPVVGIMKPPVVKPPMVGIIGIKPPVKPPVIGIVKPPVKPPIVGIVGIKPPVKPPIIGIVKPPVKPPVIGIIKPPVKPPVIIGIVKPPVKPPVIIGIVKPPVKPPVIIGIVKPPHKPHKPHYPCPPIVIAPIWTTPPVTYCPIVNPVPVPAPVGLEHDAYDLSCRLPENTQPQDLLGADVLIVRTGLDSFQLQGTVYGADNQQYELQTSGVGTMDQNMNLALVQGDQLYLEPVGDTTLQGYVRGTVELLGKSDRNGLLCTLTEHKY